MSPGSTSGTEGPDSLPLPMRLAATYVMPVIGPRLGIAHPLPTGARRLIDGITDPTLRSGHIRAADSELPSGRSCQCGRWLILTLTGSADGRSLPG